MLVTMYKTTKNIVGGLLAPACVARALHVVTHFRLNGHTRSFLFSSSNRRDLRLPKSTLVIFNLYYVL